MGLENPGEISGLRAGPLRPPLQGLDEEEKRELEQVVRTLNTDLEAIRHEASGAMRAS